MNTRIRSSWLLAVLTAMLASAVVLLNQRQTIAIYPAAALEIISIGTILVFGVTGSRNTLSTQNILAGVALLALISNLSYFSADIQTPFAHWIRLLFPVVLVPFVTAMLVRRPADIDVFVFFFSVLLLVAVYKTYNVSRVIELAQGVKRQTNWGIALAAASPFLFLIKRVVLQRILLFVVVLALVVSLKRTGFLAAVILIFTQVAMSLVTVISQRKMTRTRFRALVISGGLVAVGIVYGARSAQLAGYFDRAVARIALASEDGGSGRLDIWQRAGELMENATLFQSIFGRGFGWFHDYAIRTGGSVESLHNDLLDFWLSFGVLGALLYFALGLRLLYLAVFVSRQSKSHIAFAFSTVLIFLVYSLLTGVFFYFAFFVPLLVAIGYLEALNTLHSRALPQAAGAAPRLRSQPHRHRV